MKLEARIEVLRELLDKEYVSIKYGVSFDTTPTSVIEKMLDDALAEKADMERTKSYKGVF